MRRSSSRDAATRAGIAITRGVLVKTNDDPLMQEVDVNLLHDEDKTGVEHWQPYGFAYHAKGPTTEKDGRKRHAEAIAVSVTGNRSHPVVIAIGDRRYRVKVKEGEVALYDDLGQVVHLLRDGIVLRSPKKIRIETKDGTAWWELVPDLIRSAVRQLQIRHTKDVVEVGPEGAPTFQVSTVAGPSPRLKASIT